MISTWFLRPCGSRQSFEVINTAVRTGTDDAPMAIDYGHVYVARVAFGAKDAHTVKALQDAESYPGPSLVIGYSHCIAHGYDMEHGLDQQKLAVETGYWPLFRYDPRLAAQGQNPFTLDSGAPKGDLGRFTRNEARFRLVEQQDPERFKTLLAQGLARIAPKVLDCTVVFDPKPAYSDYVVLSIDDEDWGRAWVEDCASEDGWLYLDDEKTVVQMCGTMCAAFGTRSPRRDCAG